MLSNRNARAKASKSLSPSAALSSSLQRREAFTTILTAFAHYGFPEGEVFKWSPAKDHWMRDNLVGDWRTQFFSAVLEAAHQHGARAVVAMVEPNWGRAVAKTPPMDAMTLALERYDNFLAASDCSGVVMAAESGSAQDEDRLLAECLTTLKLGTDFVSFRRIATNVVTMPFKHSRLLHVADVVASASTALAAGNTEFSQPLVQHIKPMLLVNGAGCVGGVGMKMHPDYCFGNLYHWLRGDLVDAEFGKRTPLPQKGHPYESGPDVFQ